jgi:hypothetical protein
VSGWVSFGSTDPDFVIPGGTGGGGTPPPGGGGGGSTTPPASGGDPWGGWSDGTSTGPGGANRTGSSKRCSASGDAGAGLVVLVIFGVLALARRA